MIGFLRPQFLMLAIPLAYVIWQTRSRVLVTNVLRVLLASALVLALAEPHLSTSATGRDLIIVVDRSLSMPATSEKDALELIRLAEENLGEGDRVGVVSFGGSVTLERLPSDSSAFPGFLDLVDRDASDLHEALDTAVNLIPEGRAGSVLLLSDGEISGRDPLPIARRAFARGRRIDARSFSRTKRVDLSVERIELPESAAANEPFQFSAWVEADHTAEATLVLERNGQEISRTKRTLSRGMNRVLLRDVLQEPGVTNYRLRIEGARDRIPENDEGLAALRVTGARSVLILNDGGAPDVLSTILSKAGIRVAVSRPEDARLDPISLAAHRAVILENVAADRLKDGMNGLRDFVQERGGGLLMTGGEASFGVGGYHLSQVDELLPVSMELRQEHRKLSIAMSIVMDRSGSMSVAVDANRTKMDLANLGTKSVIELLSSMDSLGVIAVDSAPHIILDLVPVEDKARMMATAGSVQSMGGGIFVYDGLVEAKKMLETAPQLNRHIILFSDAADSEQQEGCLELIDEMAELNISLSVIALGTEDDVDAEFLIDIAEAGGGDAYFTTNPEELPRLFAQDTLTIARSTFVEEATATRALAALFGMGEARAAGFPTIAGYNLTYLRPEGVAGIATLDDYAAPLFSHRYHGLGRTAAYTGQVGGTFGNEVVAWDGFAEFFVTTTRWLMGQEEPAEVFTEVRREGRQAVVSLELDPDSETQVDTSELKVRMRGGDGILTEHVLERVGENRFEARADLGTGGITLGTVRLGGRRFVELPPVTLPYSPEYERPADSKAGERLMRRLAAESGGKLDATAAELFRGERRGRGWRVLSREFALAALLLMLLEIAGRRLSLWGSVRLRKKAVQATVTETETAKASRAAKPIAAPKEEPVEVAGESLTDALSKARRSANRKLGR